MTIVVAAPPRSQIHVRAPRREAPEPCIYLSPPGGRGECRMPAAPAASRALCIGRKHTSNNEYTGTPGIPARNGFNGLCRALPGDRALLPPLSADMFCLSPVGPTQLRELDASVGASGPHGFAVRSNISRQRAVDRSRIQRTRPAIPSRAKRCRVHRIPCPTSVTIAIRPSVGWDGWNQ